MDEWPDLVPNMAKLDVNDSQNVTDNQKPDGMIYLLISFFSCITILIAIFILSVQEEEDDGWTTVKGNTKKGKGKK